MHKAIANYFSTVVHMVSLSSESKPTGRKFQLSTSFLYNEVCGVVNNRDLEKISVSGTKKQKSLISEKIKWSNMYFKEHNNY